MIFAALTAGWVLCLGIGLLLGAVIGREHGYWSGYRDALTALEQLHQAQVLADAKTIQLAMRDYNEWSSAWPS